MCFLKFISSIVLWQSIFVFSPVSATSHSPLSLHLQGGLVSTAPFPLPRSRTKDSLLPRQFLADKAERLEPADAKAAALRAAAVWLRTCFVGSGTKSLSDALSLVAALSSAELLKVSVLKRHFTPPIILVIRERSVFRKKYGSAR